MLPSSSPDGDTLELPMQPAVRELLIRAYMSQMGSPVLLATVPTCLGAGYLALNSPADYLWLLFGAWRY